MSSEVDSKNNNQDPDLKIIQEIQKKVKNSQLGKSSKSITEAEKKAEPVGGANTPDWKNEEQVKEYLDNLYTEYSFQCMSERQPDGCHRLANFLENIRRQYKDATNLYKKTCDEMKYGPSCQTYAKQRSLGRGCKQDFAEACRYSFLCCDAYNLIEGCVNSGICLTEGVGSTPIDVKRGVDYFEKACDKGQPLACLKLFKIYIDGVGTVSRNAQRAFECTVRACENGDLLGCMNASLMLRKGDGIPKDLKKAEEFYDKADAIRKRTNPFEEKQNITFGEQHR